MNEFERELDEIESRCRTAIARQIADTDLFTVDELSKELPTLIQRRIEEDMRPATNRLETSLQTLAENLQQEYPRLELGFLGMHTPHLPDDQPIREVAGGVASLALGSGLMIAGQAAAASIATANAAAIAAATTTVAAPSLISTLGSVLLPNAAGIFSFLGTGTATVSAPVALTTTPLWVAMSGPVGWTLIGLGVAAVPFAWRTSKLKTRQKLDEAGQVQIGKIFERLRKQRISQLRDMGDDILSEFRARIDSQLDELERTIQELLAQRPDEAGPQRLQASSQSLAELVASVPVSKA